MKKTLTGRRNTLTYILLAIFAIFCGVVGYMLAGNHVSVWGVALFVIVGVLSMEFAYFSGLLINNWR